MKIIVGLGNPGRKYDGTRHNVGWWALDHLADVWRFAPWRQEGDALVAEGLIGDARVRLIKPQTYMNLSGVALRPYLRRLEFSGLHHLLVLVDEVAIPIGTLRLRAAGSAGGHNGLKSINECLGTQEYPRIRLGVGRHPHMPADVYLLSKVTGEDWTILMGAVKVAADAVEMALKEGLPKAMNTFNQKKDESREP